MEGRSAVLFWTGEEEEAFTTFILQAIFFLKNRYSKTNTLIVHINKPPVLIVYVHRRIA
jgi:hypothetical protein